MNRKGVMDEQSGETEEEDEVIGEGIRELKYRNWYQNKVGEEIKGVDFRDTVKHTERSDQ